MKSNKGVEYVLDNAGDRRSLRRHGNHELRVRRDLIRAISQPAMTKRFRAAMLILRRAAKFPGIVATVPSAEATARVLDSARL